MTDNLAVYPISLCIIAPLGYKLKNELLVISNCCAQTVLHIAVEPIKDFSAVRNAALEKCSENWILVLDTDEVIGEQDFIKLANNLIKLEADGVDGINFYRTDFFGGKKLKYGEAANQKQLRLFKKEKGKFVSAIHEQVEIAGNTSEYPLEIKHYSHKNISEFFSKIYTYANIAGHERAKNSKSIMALLLQLLFYPPGKFIYNYFLKLGFLDGWIGLMYAFMMSLHSLFVRIFWWETLLQEKLRGEIN